MLPERLMLLFGGTAKDEEQVDSGFGPFGLCRLAIRHGRTVFHGASESRGGQEGAAVGDGGDVVLHFAVLRRARDAKLPARLRDGQAVRRAVEVE